MHITDKVRTFFKERWPYYAAWLLGIIFSVFVFHAFRDNLLDADMSSEMILGKLLCEEGSLFSDNWLYSTELRVFNVHLIYKYLFCFLSDWHLVRTLAIAVILLLLAFSYAYFSERMQLGGAGLLCGLFFTVPFCLQYGQFVLYAGVYFPHVFFMLWALALAVRFRSPVPSAALLACNMLLAFCSGLGGVRGALLIYIPLVLTALCLIGYYRYIGREDNKPEDLTDKINYLLVSSALLFMSYIPALIINAKILSRHYSFVNFAAAKQKFHFDLLGLFKSAYDSVVSVFGGKYYYDIQCDSGIRVAAAALFCLDLLSAIIFLFVRFKRLKFEHKYILLFAVIGFACNTAACFITGKMVARYIMLSLLMWLPVLAIFLNTLREWQMKAAYNCALITASAYLCLQLAVFCRYPFFHDNVVDDPGYINCLVHCPASVHCGYHKAAAEWLLKNGYRCGFATFWHSNLLTEYSDGKIEMWTLRNGGPFRYLDTDWVDFRIVPWLQYRSHVYEPPRGKVFLMLSSAEAAQDKQHLYADSKYLVYKNPGLRIYGYDSYERILDNRCGKNLNGIIKVYSPAKVLQKDRSEHLRLRPYWSVSGPSLVLLKGRYKLVMDCDIPSQKGLEGRIRFRTADGKEHKLPFKLRGGINEIPFILEENVSRWGIDIKNKSKRSVSINKTEIVGGGKSVIGSKQRP